MLRRCDVDVDCDLQSIVRCCTVLDSLHIQAISQLAASRYSRLSDAIRSCNRLVTLCCPPLDSTAWEYLSNLPTLVKLDIHGHGADHLLDQDNLNLAPFVNVTSFTFRPAAPTFVTVANMITVLQRSEFPSLKESKLCVGDTPWAQAEQLFRALSQKLAGLGQLIATG
ncbi:hypothetical protein AZE42_07192 [Rhizopogon vesiculosus]|uniref:F-box domain-containing protein n=1 Tax=Rhizopogon vesiculosus TaxID=180088 RepID=A0A1J8PTF4_9AGAM|nr:hypothetical protein AZE42_07192 [Rhizopogon vesiculosus]